MWLQRKRGNCVQVKTEKSAQDLITNSNIVKTTSVGIWSVLKARFRHYSLKHEQMSRDVLALV